MVAAAKKCSFGSKLYKGRVYTVEECGSICRRYSSMFVFGTRSYGHGDEVCSDDVCDCYCEKMDPDDWTDGEGTCYMEHSYTFDLYRFLQSTPSNYATVIIKKTLVFQISYRIS